MQLVVAAGEAGRRLDVFLAERVAGASRAKLQKLIAAGGVRVNGQAPRAKDLVATGDVVELDDKPVRSVPPLVPVALPLDVLYEDEHVIVINKPAGLSVHPGAGEQGVTLVQGLLHHCKALGRATQLSVQGEDEAASDAGDGELTLEAEQRPGIVHRLDKDTTGVLVCAKTDIAHAALAKQFHDKTNDREYLALLDGVMTKEEMAVESYLHRDPRARLKQASTSVADYQTMAARAAKGLKAFRYAKTYFRREAVFADRLTLARVRLETGRTHQIRVHALSLKMPVVGDALYHPHMQLPSRFPIELQRRIAATTRQMLHARLLAFTHPTTGERLSFEAPLPADFAELLALLAPLSAGA